MGDHHRVWNQKTHLCNHIKCLSLSRNTVTRLLAQGGSCGEYSVDIIFMHLSKRETHSHDALRVSSISNEQLGQIDLSP
jgi:hypothetical protein